MYSLAEVRFGRLNLFVSDIGANYWRPLRAEKLQYILIISFSGFLIHVVLSGQPKFLKIGFNLLVANSTTSSGSSSTLLKLLGTFSVANW